jgi:hypothetical protein
MSEYIMTVDPGSAHCGIAIWSTQTWADGTLGGAVKSLVSYMTLETSSDMKTKLGVVGAMCKAIATLVSDKNILDNLVEVHVEMPAIFLSCARGISATEDVIDTVMICGYIKGLLESICEVYYIPVIDWKGTLPKKICNERVKKIFEKEGYPLSRSSTHALDAVGIGLYKQGAF